MEWLPDHWAGVFALETPLVVLAVRGALLYLAILFLLRVLPRRMTGELAAMDLVLILLITEAAAHSLGEYHSLADGVVQIAVMAMLALLIDILSHRFEWFRNLTQSPPLKIIANGKVLRRNLRREFISNDELQSQLRANNIRDVSEVLSAHVEGEGHITFVKKAADADAKTGRKQRTAH